MVDPRKILLHIVYVRVTCVATIVPINVVENK
jgi:hypothetical protein